MNVNEYGNTLRFNVGQDISLNLNKIELRSPSPVVRLKTITASEGLVIGTIDVVTPEGTFLANEYVEYVIQEGDIHSSGLWEARVYSQTPDLLTCRITDNIKTFTVDK